MSPRGGDYAFLVKPWGNKAAAYYKDKFRPAFESVTRLQLKPFERLYKQVDETLYHGIQSAIRDASFVVVDATLGLPNIYWEYGYALAAARPILLVTRKGQDKIGKDKLMNFIGEMKNQNAANNEYKSRLKEIVRRHYDIPTDVQGVVYNDAPEKFTIRAKRDLKRLVDKSFLQAYERPQISELTEFQYAQYLRCLDKGEQLSLYYEYDGLSETFDGLSGFLKKIDGKRRMGRLFINFLRNKDESQETFDSFQALVNDYPDVRVVPLQSRCKYILLDRDVAFFSSDGGPPYFARGSSGMFDRLNQQLLDSGVVVGCRTMLAHAAQMATQFGHEDIGDLNRDGITFDTHSKLWLTDPQKVLTYIVETRRLCDYLHDKITARFDKFADFYLKKTCYIMAFWPLDKESIDWAKDKNSPVRSWVKILNDWARRRSKGSAGMPVDRFFVIPATEACLNNGKYELQRPSYKRMVRDFFKEIFPLNKCVYRDNVRVVFNIPEVRSKFFDGGASRILGKNVVFFSRRKFESLDEYVGVLQYEDPYEFTNESSGRRNSARKRRIMNLRYLPVNSESGRHNDTALHFVEELKVFTKQIHKSTRRIVKGHRVPMVVHVDKFLKETVGIDAP